MTWSGEESVQPECQHRPVIVGAVKHCVGFCEIGAAISGL